jgi:DNA helicase II / ATP-dependent DNA helicase PcrA
MTTELLQTARFSASDIARLVGTNPPTAEQIAVIEAPLQPGVIIAGAGSGKTETIATRVVWLVANGLVTPDRVLGLTFTRKAAGELSHRIQSRLRRFRHSVQPLQERSASAAVGDAVLGEPTVSTYAAYAAAIVDEHGLRLGAEPGAGVLSNAGRWQLAAEVVSRFDGDFDEGIGVPRSVTKYVLSLADELASHLVGDATVIDFTRRLEATLLALDQPAGFAVPVRTMLQRAHDRVTLLQLVEDFRAAKAARHVHDFGDKMRLASLLAALPSVQAAERGKFDIVLLDEYQDTSHSETVLLAQLFADGRSVTAVGDPLQAIYGWRGASASNITSFAARFRCSDGTDASTFSLMTSWRNDRAILTAANTVAAAVRPAGQQQELAARPDAAPGLVQITFAATVLSEADWIADKLAAEWHGRTDWSRGERTAAVLVRKRSHIPAIVTALQGRQLPVEVLSLGGLLSLPEVVDVVSTLRVLTDVRAGAALARLLTGDRWRIGLADLAALADRAATLARAELPVAPDVAQDPPQPTARPEPHLIDALESLGDPRHYSSAGYHRLKACAGELSSLRRRLDQSLPDLIEDIVRVSGLGVELAVRGGAGRANLDRLVEEAARFSTESIGTVASFLGYLSVAREEDRGLETVESQVQAERIQVLTVHGAKGLEWDVVALPGLAEGSFPAGPQGESWTTNRGRLPFELRGDADALPALDLNSATTCREANKVLTEFSAAVNAHRLAEERRLAYVAMTRPRKALYCSGAAWGTGSTARLPAGYLVQLREVAEVEGWHEVADGDVNPLTSEQIGAQWPRDPLGADRAATEAAATRVRANLDQPGERAETPWRRDVDLLLAERRERSRLIGASVELPASLSTSEAVQLAQDPVAFARNLRRPLPRQPSAAADLGTALHEWLEQHYRSEALLELDDLMPPMGEDRDSAAFAALRRAFLASPWADRTPLATEVRFELPLGSAIIRGRMDAVFADTDGGFTVIDWKTGSVPRGTDSVAKAVQLATYRLAWARLHGIADSDLGSVRAGFHYVAAGLTVYPEELLDAAALRALVSPGDVPKPRPLP